MFRTSIERIKSMPRTVSGVVLSLIAIAALNGVLTSAQAQGRPENLPPGKWTFAAGPYFGPDYESIPVDVFRVTTDARKGLAVTSVGLHNKETRDVTGVKLRWYLKDRGQADRVLLEGTTPMLGVLVPAGKARILEYPVASFAKIHKPLLKSGELTGQFRLEVAVAEVQYADTTSPGNN
jgi:hypothetical protein